MIPSALIAPYVARCVLAEDGCYGLAERAGVSREVVERLAYDNCRNDALLFDVADRLMCAMNLPHYWWEVPELAEVYYSDEAFVVTAGHFSAPERVCARVGCSNEVVGRKDKIYCGESCAAMASAVRLGKRPRKSESAFRSRDGKGGHVCRNGHERTPENTRVTEDGRRECRECVRERSRRAYKNNAEKIKRQRREKYHAEKRVA